jgi:hypothetical protein
MFDDFEYGFGQLLIVYHDTHTLPTEYIRRAHQHRKSYPVRNLYRILSASSPLRTQDMGY